MGDNRDFEVYGGAGTRGSKEETKKVGHLDGGHHEEM